MDSGDYQRFYNFLAAHECQVDYREFRTDTAVQPAQPRRAVLPPLESGPERERPRAASRPAAPACP